MNKERCEKCQGTGKIITEHVHSVFTNAECYLVELCDCGQGLSFEQQMAILDFNLSEFEKRSQVN